MVDLFTRDVAFKFVKFGVVGFSGVIVDFGFTYICKEWLKIQKYIANAVGFTIAQAAIITSTESGPFTAIIQK